MTAVEADRRQRFLVAGAIVLSASLFVLSWIGDVSLRRATLLSGWCCAGLIAAGALSWWSKDLDDSSVARRVRRHAVVTIVLLSLFVIHVEGRLPGGWIDRVLAGLFMALVASTLLGVARLRGGTGSTGRISRWLSVHVALVHATLALAVVHGAIAQFHGALARFSTGK